MKWYHKRVGKHLLINNWWYYKDFLFSFGIMFQDKHFSLEINLGLIGLELII